MDLAGKLMNGKSKKVKKAAKPKVPVEKTND
jgi:hypothetical protein